MVALAIGYIDWAAQFKALKDIGYSNAVNLETHWKGPGTAEQSSDASWTGMKNALLQADAWTSHSLPVSP